MNSDLQRLLEVNVGADAELTEGVADQTDPAHMEYQEGVSGQHRLQRQQHEDIVQVSSIYSYLQEKRQHQNLIKSFTSAEMPLKLPLPYYICIPLIFLHSLFYQHIA